MKHSQQEIQRRRELYFTLFLSLIVIAILQNM
jgi:hypothetical protein